jgi:ABC-2 type transport system permease protein
MPSKQYTALRIWSMLKKEFIQIKHDYTTYILLLFIPFLQLLLFGYIIDTNAKNLPTIVVNRDFSPFANTLINAFKNTGYLAIKSITQDNNEAEKLLKQGEVQFIINIPQNFSRDLIREKQPHLLIEGDGTDPVAVYNAFDAASTVASTALNKDMQGSLNYLLPKEPNFITDTHAKFNPALISQYHTLPGLLVTLLTVTLVILTAVSVTSEYESGTMEVLLVTPIKPLEVIIGKIIPYIILGYILFFLALAVSYWLFRVPIYGSIFLLIFTALPFIISSLGVGFAVSTVSSTQLRAANLANMYTLPSVLLTGFMFPFHAMPKWAQVIGELLPPTHYLRILLNVMLKGAGFIEILPDLWPILVFMVLIVFFSFKYYRHTLD